MKANGTFLNILILLMLSNIIKGWFIEFETCHQQYNPNIVKSLDFQLINSKNSSAITGFVIFNQDLDEFEISFFITAPKRNGKPWTMLNITINGCDFIGKSRRKNMHFPYIVLGEIRASNLNFPKKCPVEKDTKIVFKNFYINSERISLNFPELSFNCDFTVTRHRVQAFKVSVSGSVKTMK